MFIKVVNAGHSHFIHTVKLIHIIFLAIITFYYVSEHNTNYLCVPLACQVTLQDVA